MKDLWRLFLESLAGADGKASSKKMLAYLFGAVSIGLTFLSLASAGLFLGACLALLGVSTFNKAPKE
jgi:hypothetical protein